MQYFVDIIENLFYNISIGFGLTKNRRMMMQYEKLIAPTITELFESKIQSGILSGDLKIGEKLPTERELAESMGISKSAVHLGIKNLERSGFIRIVPRQGIYVANWAENGDLATLSALLKSNVLKLEKNNIAALIKMREAIEGDAMAAFAENHSEEQIQVLCQITEEIRKGETIYSVDQLAEYAYRFSHQICFFSGNPFSSLVMNAFKPFALSLWREWIKQIGSRQAADYLLQMAQLIERGDGHGAIEIEHCYHQDFLERIERPLS